LDDVLNTGKDPAYHLTRLGQLDLAKVQPARRPLIAGIDNPVMTPENEADKTAKRLTEFAKVAMTIADRRTIEVIGKVENASFIFEKTGLDVSGFTRVVDNYGVRHTIKQHGDQAKESKRGQLAVTLDDFGLIPLITSQPDNVFADGKNKIGRDVIVFEKLINGIGYRHVEELRGKHKLVATDSMRKKKGAWSAL